MANEIRCALIVFDPEGKILIEHPFGFSKTKPHCWDIPKGHFDSTLDFKSVDVALRECEEETGLVFDREDTRHIVTIDYNGDTLHVFGIFKPIEIDTNQLFCNSKIEDCPQTWKNGKPEVDDYKLVSIDEALEYLYKGYNNPDFIEYVSAFIKDHI